MRAANFAYDVYDFARKGQYAQYVNPPVREWVIPPGYETRWECPGGPGDVTLVNLQPIPITSCSPLWSPAPPGTGNNPINYYNVDWTNLHPTFNWPRCYPLVGFWRQAGVPQSPIPALVDRPGRQWTIPPWSEPELPPVPHYLVPQMKPSPDPQMGRTENPPQSRPSPKQRHQFAPPPAGTQEKKANVPAWLAGIANTAWEFTEMVDLIDALYDALPADIRRRVKPTGRVSRSGWNPGMPYISWQDKAVALSKNWRHLNVSDAVRNVALNQMIDSIVGRIAGGANRYRRDRFTTMPWLRR